MTDSPPPAAGGLLVLQTGGPTAVINATLAAIVTAARGRFRSVHGVRRGLEGLVHGHMVALDDLPDARLAALRRQPGAALGSSRKPLNDAHIAQVVATLQRADAVAVLMIGGNGTMRAARQLDTALRGAGSSTRVVGVPKTVDNDIPGTDRCPGYTSAARFVAQSVRDVVEDVRTLPVPVSIFETMGRDAGWLTAASVLARSPDCPGPQIILVPEHRFESALFLRRVDHAMRRDGWVVVATSEGIRDAGGRPVFETDVAAHRDDVGRPVPGDVGPYLARLVGRELGLRCRSEKPGLCGRTSIPLVSDVDRADAAAVGRAAVEAVIAGAGGVMVTLEPLVDGTAASRTGTVPLEEMGTQKRDFPADWIDDRGEPNARFVDYLAPRIGMPIQRYERL